MVDNRPNHWYHPFYVQERIMAKRGKKAHNDPPEEWKISIRQSTAARVGLLLTDPLTGKIKHGARGQLIDRLLTEWVNNQQKN